jgi:hypothetical protein
VQPAGELEQDLLQPALHAGGEIGMHGRPPRLGGDRRGVPGEVDVAHREPAGAVGADQRAEVVQERRRPVGRHRHHLVLVRRAPEAEVRGELLVEQPQRVRQYLGGQHLQPPALVAARQVRGALAAAVEHQHAARVVPGGECRGRGVRDVMWHPAEVAPPAAERGLEEQRRPPGVQGAQALPVRGGDVAVGLGREVGLIRICDSVEF